MSHLARVHPYASKNHKIQNIPELKQFLEGIKPRLLLRNLPVECSQVKQN